MPFFATAGAKAFRCLSLPARGKLLEQIKTIIKPSSGISLQLKELWQHRELLYFFAWRDIKVRYKQTTLGIIWALLQPLGMMLLFVLVFSRSSIASSTPIRYEIFVLSGLVLWNLFYNAVSQASESMITNSSIIKKIYFPRLVIPLAALCSSFVDFLIGLVMLLVFCLIFHQPVSISALIYFPLAILILLITSFGLGTLLGALNVKYRDFRYALPFFLQFLFFATQIIYPASIIQNRWLQYLFAMNPVNTAIELFRHPFGTAINENMVYMGVASSLLMALAGLFYFKKTESYFADIV